MKNLSTIVGIVAGAVVGAYVILFALYNRTVVKVDFIVGHPKLPLYAVAATFLVIGGAAVGIGAGVLAMRGRGRRRALTRRLAQKDEELKRLRNAPLTDPVGTPVEDGAKAREPGA